MMQKSAASEVTGVHLSQINLDIPFLILEGDENPYWDVFKHVKC